MSKIGLGVGNELCFRGCRVVSAVPAGLVFELLFAWCPCLIYVALCGKGQSVRCMPTVWWLTILQRLPHSTPTLPLWRGVGQKSETNESE